MVKKIILILILLSSIYANLQEKIESFMSKEEYIKQENLVKILFKNSDEFYRKSDGNVDSLKVIRVLKESGLFKLFFDKPIFLSMEFITKENPLIFMKVVSESLESIGYNYFLTKSVKKSDNSFVWEIGLKTKHLINPILFSKELQKRGCKIVDISRKERYFWVYKIDSKNAKLDASSVDVDRVVKFKKPIKPYILFLEDDYKDIEIKSTFSDHWYPLITFFDTKLDVIYQKKIDKRTYQIKVDIPSGSRYIQIGDIYTLENIKHGLSVHIRTFE